MDGLQPHDGSFVGNCLPGCWVIISKISRL